ncbi:unnamed protein product [Paramecium pentaurelia]|uniref:Uncharacterized protein n=1 Tax=Paramecium pentaurelia TaxID=43138 RepID=A0A8S1YHJ5_9CILI|nr:unnamed protein product [Paramecium pentaurelia]
MSESRIRKAKLSLIMLLKNLTQDSKYKIISFVFVDDLYQQLNFFVKQFINYIRNSNQACLINGC